MKKLLLTVVFITFILGSCSNNEEKDVVSNEDIEKRALALGFPDAETYTENVQAQCALGNHENCHINSNGSHTPCADTHHSGKKHDGSHHQGEDHGSHHNGSHGGHHKH